jgi:hypothetical protein
MYDAQFEMIAGRIDEIETLLACIHDSSCGDHAQELELEAELAELERRLEQIELLASYEPSLAGVED